MASAPSAPRLSSGQTRSLQERSLVPVGMATILPEAARHVRRIEALLLDLIHRWGYDEIILPTFEYLDVLAPGLEPDLIEQCYQFADRTTGRILLLRPDATAQIARTVAMGLMGARLPLRLSYRASVFRYEQEHAGRDREIFQVGAELIGADDATADGEIVSLLIECLRHVGLRSFKLSLGHVGFFKSLLIRAGLSPDQQRQAEQAAARKDLPKLQEIIATTRVSKKMAQAILEAPELCGQSEVLGRGRTLAGDDKSALQALDRLTKVYQWLCMAGYEDCLFLDLGEFRGFDYYDGVVFDVFAEGVGVELGGGGRYDHLIGRFGRNTPSTGFALNVDRLFRSLALSLSAADARRLDVLVVASRSSTKTAFAVVGQLRQGTRRVRLQTVSAAEQQLLTAAFEEGLREEAQVVVVVNRHAKNDGVVVAERQNGRFQVTKRVVPLHELAARLGSGVRSKKD